MYGDMRGMILDAATNRIWVYADYMVNELLITNEDHSVWRSYLSKGKYDTALQYCRDLSQREQVCLLPQSPCAGKRHHAACGMRPPDVSRQRLCLQRNLAQLPVVCASLALLRCLSVVALARRIAAQPPGCSRPARRLLPAARRSFLHYTETSLLLR